MKQYNNLGELLIDFRKHSKLSQLDFAAIMEVDARTIIRWEKNVSLIKVEKEKVLTEIFRIPHQVIRNLNTDTPISILFDFERWVYASSSLLAYIKNSKDFEWNIKLETQNIHQLTKNEDFEFIDYIHENQKNCNPLHSNVIKSAARLLPELNLVYYGNSGFHAGHISILPLKYESYLKIHNREMDENNLTESDLSRNRVDTPTVFHYYSLYANSYDSAHFLMNRLLYHFKTKKYANYIFSGITYRELMNERLKELGIEKIWTDENENDCPNSRTFCSGNFDEVLFEKKNL